MANEMGEIPLRCFFVMQDADVIGRTILRFSFCDWYCFDKNLYKQSEEKRNKLHNRFLLYHVFPVLIQKKGPSNITVCMIVILVLIFV